MREKFRVELTPDEGQLILEMLEDRMKESFSLMKPDDFICEVVEVRKELAEFSRLYDKIMKHLY